MVEKNSMVRAPPGLRRKKAPARDIRDVSEDDRRLVRAEVGRELDRLARGLADLHDLGGPLLAHALSDIASRLVAGQPVEDWPSTRIIDL